MQLYGFTARDVDRIHALLAAFEQGRIRQDAPPQRGIVTHQQDSFLVRTSTSIPAGQVGTAQLVDLDTTTPAPIQTALSYTSVSVYNSTANSLPAGTYFAMREPSQGYYVIPDAPNSSPTVGQSQITSGTTIASNVWTTVPLQVTLPANTTCLAWATLTGVVQKVGNGSTSSILVILYDVTNSVQLGPSVVCTGILNGSTTLTYAVEGSGTVVFPVVTTSSILLGCQAYFSDPGGTGTGSYSQGNIGFVPIQ